MAEDARRRRCWCRRGHGAPRAGRAPGPHCGDPRHRAPRRHRASPRRRPPHGAGERAGPVRPRQLRGVRRSRHRRPAGAPQHRGSCCQHAGRRPGGRHRAGQRRPLRQRAVPLRRALVRLLRAGGDARADEPPQEGSPLRAGGTTAPARRALRRGRGRSPRRHRHGGGDRARHGGLRALRRTERQGATRRHRVRTLLRRQRRAPGVLPRHHRHPRRQHRDGWARHDRGRRVGRLPPRGDRAGVGAGAERGRRCPLRRREGSRRGGPPVPVVLPGGCAGVDGARPGAAAGRRAAGPPARLRHPAGGGAVGRRGVGPRTAAVVRARGW